MGNIEKAIIQLNEASSVDAGAGAVSAIDPRARLIVTLSYILAVLSIPVADPASILWMAIYPISISEASGVGYATVFKKSLWLLPLVVMIGIFNPLFDHANALQIGNLSINRGWLTFASLVLRGFLAFQALLVLVLSTGFFDICRGLQRLRLPSPLVTQLMMLYRYIGVLLREALSMQRARAARGYGRRSYPLKMWGVFVGQLFIRSIDRARRVNAAMLARGFTGVYNFAPFSRRFGVKDWAYLVIWIAMFAILRFVDFTQITGHLIMS